MLKDVVVKTRHFRQVYQPIVGKELSIKPTSDFKKVMMSMKEIRDGNVDRSLICAKGGKTQVALYNGETKLAEAEAVCGKHDIFCRKLGRTVALGKALKNMGVVK